MGCPQTLGLPWTSHLKKKIPYEVYNEYNIIIWINSSPTWLIDTYTWPELCLRSVCIWRSDTIERLQVGPTMKIPCLQLVTRRKSRIMLHRRNYRKNNSKFRTLLSELSEIIEIVSVITLRVQPVIGVRTMAHLK